MAAPIRQCPYCDTRTSQEYCAVHAVPTIDAEILEHPPEPIEPGAVISRRYRVEKMISVGGFGAVYLGTQLGMHREVAIKVLRRERLMGSKPLKRFYREAQAISKLSHPNIVQVFDFGIDEQSKVPFIVFEYVKGQTLTELLLSVGPISEVRSAELLSQLAGALVEAKAQGIVHRDLKPNNLIISTLRDGSSHLKVLDFGLVKVIGDKDAMTGLTKPGSMIGTAHFASPEQLMGARVDFQSDLYSLGCLMYASLTGEPPFDGSPIELLDQHARTPPPALPQRLADGRPPSAGLKALYTALLLKAPSKRPADPGVVAKILSGLARRETINVAAILEARVAPGARTTLAQPPMRAEDQSRKIPKDETEPAGMSHGLSRGMALRESLNDPISEDTPLDDATIATPAARASGDAKTITPGSHPTEPTNMGDMVDGGTAPTGPVSMPSPSISALSAIEVELSWDHSGEMKTAPPADKGKGIPTVSERGRARPSRVELMRQQTIPANSAHVGVVQAGAVHSGAVHSGAVHTGAEIEESPPGPSTALGYPQTKLVQERPPPRLLGKRLAVVALSVAAGLLLVSTLWSRRPRATGRPGPKKAAPAVVAAPKALRPEASSKTPPKTPPKPPVVRSAEPGPLKQVMLRSRPAGARVYVEGKRLGHTPMAVSVRSEEGIAVRLTKAGYQSRTLRLRGERSEISVVLQANTRAAPPPSEALPVW